MATCGPLAFAAASSSGQPSSPPWNFMYCERAYFSIRALSAGSHGSGTGCVPDAVLIIRGSLSQISQSQRIDQAEIVGIGASVSRRVSVRNRAGIVFVLARDADRSVENVGHLVLVF